MSIPFTCPHCGVTTQVGGTYAGQAGPCVSCGATVTIPAMDVVRPRGRSCGGMVAAVLLASLVFCGGIIGSLRLRTVTRDAARGVWAQSQIAQMGTALESYNLDVSDYPTTEQGLDALMECPADLANSDTWGGPYIDMEEIPTDPWGNPFQYVYPGVDNPNDLPDIWSMGPDGIGGTEDDIAGEE